MISYWIHSHLINEMLFIPWSLSSLWFLFFSPVLQVYFKDFKMRRCSLRGCLHPSVSPSQVIFERRIWLFLRVTRTAGFIICDYLVVTYCPFLFIFVFDGRTDRRTDILMSFLNCPWLSLGPCQISSSSERRKGRFSSFENNMGQTDLRTCGRTDGRTRALIGMRSRI